MNFDEFFKKKERPNYVEVETPDGKKVSVSKTAKSVYDPKTKEQKVANAPIGVDGLVEEKKPSLRETIIPKEDPIPTGTRQYTSPAVQPLVSTKVKETVLPNVKSEGPSAWERALIGATPLLVGLLTGNELEGMQVAGNQLATEEGDRYKRQKDFEQKLAEMKAQRETASTSKMVAKTFEYKGSDGVNRIGRFVNGQQFIDEANDPQAPVNASKENWQKTTVWDDKIQDYVEKFVNPSSGEEFVAGKAQPKFRPDMKQLPTVTANGEVKYQTVENNVPTGYLPGQVPQKAENLREDGRDRRAKDQRAFQAVQKYASANGPAGKHKLKMEAVVNAMDILNKGGPIGESGIPSLIARGVFGEVGVLTEQDVQRIKGDPSLIAKSERLYAKAIKGEPFSSDDRKDIYTVLKAAYESRRILMQEEMDAYIKAHKALGIDIDAPIRSYTKIPNLPGLGSGIKPARSSNYVPVQPGEVREGYRFKGGDRKDPNNYEKVN